MGKKHVTYRLNKQVVKVQRFEEASNNYAFWNNKTHEERLMAANYLNSIAWGFDLDDPPKMLKTHVQLRLRE